MTFDLTNFAPARLSVAHLRGALATHECSTRPRLELLWNYYRNPISAIAVHAPDSPHSASRRYRLAQERGLPARLLGAAGRSWGHTLPDDRANPWARKEIVIENDIAWRIHTMVDFLLGRPVVLSSTAQSPDVRAKIQLILDAVWEASGGISLMQDLALLGHIFGHVDLLVRTNNAESPPAEAATPSDTRPIGEIVREAVRALRVEIIEPTRGLAITNPADYRRIDAYILRYRRDGAPGNAAGKDTRESAATNAPGNTLWRRFLSLGTSGSDASSTGASSVASARPSTIVTEILTGNWHQVYEQDAHDRNASPRLVDERAAFVDASRDPAFGPPVVHIQNLSQPFAFAGLSEVEPLMPLQDELNTRLSDRASRVTLQSFRMLLAKGLGETNNLSVAPGVIWQTDNPEASVESFGGDSASPSEDRHIDEIREALDKVSGVPPLAAGVVRAKIGNLSSENALRVTLMGLLSKTARKRIAYGKGLSDASRLILEALDRLGIFRTSEADRTVRIEWPDPLPRDERDALDAAIRKVELGVPRERILAELGYPTSDPVSAGVQ